MHATPFLPLTELVERRSVKWRTYDPDVLPLWVAEMDVALAPAVAEALHAAVDRGDAGYVHPGALADVYAAFSARRYGWAPAPERVSLVPDVMGGIAAALRLATMPGDTVVVNPPVYPPFWEFVRHAERSVEEVPLRQGVAGYELDLAGLEAAFSRGATAYLLCNPQNPTGSVWDRAALTAVADLADRHDVLVLADEIHAPLTYAGVDHIPFASLDHPGARRAVTFVSASKAWNLPGLKAGMMLAGPDAPRPLLSLPHAVQIGAGLFGVIAATAAFTDGESWLTGLLDHLDANRRLLADLLSTHLPTVGYRVPSATYLAWLDCRALGLGDDPSRVFLERGRVAVNAGHTFGREGRGFVRCNLGTSPDVITDAVRRMAAALDD